MKGYKNYKEILWKNKSNITGKSKVYMKKCNKQHWNGRKYKRKKMSTFKKRRLKIKKRKPSFMKKLRY